MVTAVAIGIVVLRLWLSRCCVDGGLGLVEPLLAVSGGAALVW
eukprot:COSAG01_NODE_1156_length_11478_cov_3.862642_3_plen_43_part_00